MATGPGASRPPQDLIPGQFGPRTPNSESEQLGQVRDRTDHVVGRAARGKHSKKITLKYKVPDTVTGAKATSVCVKIKNPKGKFSKTVKFSGARP